MLKKYYILLVSVFVSIVSVSFAQDNYNCKEMGLKGNVKSILETQYKLNDINPGINEIFNTTISFNKNCQKTSEVSTEIGGDLKNRHTVTYDKSGNVTSEVRQNKDVNGNFNVRYKYNSAKRLLQKELITGGRVISTYIYTYDDNGNVSAMEIKKKLGLLDINNENFTYKYDGKNRLIEEVYTEKEEYRRTEYLYDDSDKLIRLVEYNHRGGIAFETDYEYDELDNLSVEKVTYRDSSIDMISYLYEYDEHGNWINKRSLLNEKTFSIQVRVITYY